MYFKAVTLCFSILLIKNILAQYVNLEKLQNGLTPNSFTSNLAQNNFASNLYGANIANLGANNLANLYPTGSNIALGNLAPNVISNNLFTDNIGNQAMKATNSLLNAANAASSSISSGLLEGLSASNGGVLSVISTSPIAPIGVSVYADNLLIEGPLAVSGQLPFLSAVAFEGTVPSSGQGVTGCGCGDGNVGIVSELNNAGSYGVGRPGLGRFY